MTRAFVAVVPPGAALDAVADVARDLRGAAPRGARFTTREQHHFTLQFLGNHADIDAVGAALAPLAVSPGTVQIGGGGAFPSARRGRVLWLGVTDGHALLVRLSAAVHALVAPLAFETDPRPYRPHCTLARWNAPTDLRGAVSAVEARQAVGPAWTVTDVVLFESRLHPDGARYVAREVVALAG